MKHANRDQSRIWDLYLEAEMDSKGTLQISVIGHNGDNFCDFPFALLYNKPLLISSLQEYILSV